MVELSRQKKKRYVQRLLAFQDLSPIVSIDEPTGTVYLPPSFVELLRCAILSATWLQAHLYFPQIDLAPRSPILI